MPDIVPPFKTLLDQGRAPALPVDVALFAAHFTCNARGTRRVHCRFVGIPKRHARAGTSRGRAIIPRNDGFTTALAIIATTQAAKPPSASPHPTTPPA